MPGQNTLIIATDYNEIQSIVSQVLGTGSGTLGYGQTLASSQVGQYSKVTTNQWNNLRSDILRARQHQTGTNLSTALQVASASRKIQESDRAAYKALAQEAQVNALTAPPPSSEASRIALVGEQIRTTPWNGTLIQTVTVTFGPAGGAGADAARYFFNSGSQIEFSAERTGGTAGLKNVTWTTMLASMGTVAFNYTKTECSGSGFNSTLGWYDLTTSDALIFQKDTPSSTYAPNKYYIYGRVNSTSDRRIGIYTIHFEDSSGKPPSYPDPGFGIDENVDGTLVSTVNTYRATGSNVSVPNPSASTTSIS